MLDLKSLAAGRWRLTLDESAAIPGQTEADRAWLWQVPAKYGHVYIHGRERLGVYCRSVRLLPRLLAVPGLALHQRGDREFSATFPPDALAEVADIIQARRRRQVSEGERARLAGLSLAHSPFRLQSERLPGPPSRPEGVGRGMGPSALPAGPGAALR
jgi:hypothetical protein